MRIVIVDVLTDRRPFRPSIFVVFCRFLKLVNLNFPELYVSSSARLFRVLGPCTAERLELVYHKSSQELFFELQLMVINDI